MKNTDTITVTASVEPVDQRTWLLKIDGQPVARSPYYMGTREQALEVAFDIAKGIAADKRWFGAIAIAIKEA